LTGKIDIYYYKLGFAFKNAESSAGVKTPFSVIIPSINEAGVTSKAGFHTEIPKTCVQMISFYG